MASLSSLPAPPFSPRHISTAACRQSAVGQASIWMWPYLDWHLIGPPSHDLLNWEAFRFALSVSLASQRGCRGVLTDLCEFSFDTCLLRSSCCSGRRFQHVVRQECSLQSVARPHTYMYNICMCFRAIMPCYVRSSKFSSAVVEETLHGIPLRRLQERYLENVKS